MMLDVKIIPCLSDNYAYLMHDKKNNIVGIIDPSEFEPINTIIEKKFGKLDYIFNTHHHADHIGGNLELKKKYNSKIIGYEGDKNRIPGIDILIKDGENFLFGDKLFKIMHVPGHTSGHIAFYCEKDKIIFTGDTLFSFGCGRLFEGTSEDMFRSLEKIKKLPKDIQIFCGHEYTKNNIEFCLSQNKSDEFLKRKLVEAKENLSNFKPTIPSTLEDEIAGNIFLKCKNSKDLKKLRDIKDKF